MVTTPRHIERVFDAGRRTFAINDTRGRRTIVKPVPAGLEKEYAARGPLQQFRFRAATAFMCVRCNASKKAKLITVYYGDWSKRLCNGCYGRLLSIYEVKTGARADEESAERLAEALLSLVEEHGWRDAERRLTAASAKAKELNARGLRFLATAEYVASRLAEGTDLEWSPAVIGLCKALELELIERIVRPVSARCVGADLSGDLRDRRLQRLARFCAAPDTSPPPELGALGYFLGSVSDDPEPRLSSPIVKGFLDSAVNWTGSEWILRKDGLQQGLRVLTTTFRNRAAHIDELSCDDYRNCRDLVAGEDGLLWRLVLATSIHR